MRHSASSHQPSGKASTQRNENKQCHTLASYVGLIPGERSSGRRQRLGKITKQGNPLLRFLWTEAGVHAVRRDPELKRFYHKLVQKGLGKECIMEPLARWTLPYRVSLRPQAARRHGIRVRGAFNGRYWICSCARRMGKRLRNRSLECHRGHCRSTGCGAALCALSPRSSSICPSAGEVRFQIGATA